MGEGGGIPVVAVVYKGLQKCWRVSPTGVSHSWNCGRGAGTFCAGSLLDLASSPEQEGKIEACFDSSRGTSNGGTRLKSSPHSFTAPSS